jgi:hypothetical protein
MDVSCIFQLAFPPIWQTTISSAAGSPSGTIVETHNEPPPPLVTSTITVLAAVGSFLAGDMFWALMAAASAAIQINCIG